MPQRSSTTTGDRRSLDTTPHGAAPVTVDVWRLSSDPSPTRLDELTTTLSSDERERAARFHFARDRTRFIASRGFLRSVLGRYLAIEPAMVAFDYDAHRKPLLRGSSPADLRFNLAHSGDVTLVAVAHGIDVGVDVEVRRDLADRQQIAARFFSLSEAEAIASLPEELRDEAFFACWTRKEAYLKAVGLGLSGPLDSFDVSVDPRAPAEILRIHASARAAREWSIHDLSQPPEYRAAVAVHAPRSLVVNRTGGDEIRLP
jgi:4'-phosphopantetheinyl transferase